MKYFRNRLDDYKKLNSTYGLKIPLKTSRQNYEEQDLEKYVIADNLNEPISYPIPNMFKKQRLEVNQVPKLTVEPRENYNWNETN